MGAIVSCFYDVKVRRENRQHPSSAGVEFPPRLPRSSSCYAALAPAPGGGWRDRVGEDRILTNEEALAATRLLLQDSVAVRDRMDRSASVRNSDAAEGRKKRQQQRGAFPRSTSTRPRSFTDPLLQPQHLVNQDVKIDELETSHFVLVHGGGFGAWCWYKTISLLEETGFKVDAVDLTGSGVHSFDTNKITSLSHFVKPLTDFLEKLNEGKKVILVGHDFGGACISYAMEIFPTKVAKAIFISAVMMANGQSILDMFPQEAGVDDQMRQAYIFSYANGREQPPTSIEIDKTLVNILLFNNSPAKDIALASVSLRQIPFAPILEKLSLSEKNYGSIRRYYVETTEDKAIPLPVQRSMSNSNPPERVFLLKGSDHAPFFSKPQALHRLLVDISKIRSTKTKDKREAQDGEPSQ